jgi:hypothetical protein
VLKVNGDIKRIEPPKERKETEMQTEEVKIEKSRINSMDLER